jgi:hypothetical protein
LSAVPRVCSASPSLRHPRNGANMSGWLAAEFIDDGPLVGVIEVEPF